jgi:membrane fusion protein (multidrug efflux system)
MINKMKTKQIFSIIIGLVVIVTIFVILFNNKKQLDEKAERSLKGNLSIPVNVANLQYALGMNEVEVSGRIVSDNEVLIVSKAQGIVVCRYKRQGEFVTKGTSIAKIEDEVIRKKLQLAKYDLAKAQKDVERYRSLLKADAVTATEFENAEISMREAENIVLELKEQLKNTLIVAPITGVYEKNFFEVGSLVTPGTVMGEIVDLKQLKVSATVTGKDLLKINKNTLVTVTVDIYPDKKFDGEVSLISSSGGESMTYYLEIHFKSDYSDLLRPGMYAHVNMKGKKSDAAKVLTIDRQCIIGSLKEPCVYVIENSQAYLREIIVGKVMNDRIEVLSGLNAEDVVVSNGQINLTNGCSVTIY